MLHNFNVENKEPEHMYPSFPVHLF